MEGNFFVEDVDEGAMMGGRRNSDNLRGSELKRGIYYVVNSKEREIVIFRDKLKVVRPGCKSWNQVTSVNVRLIIGRMRNEVLGVRESKTSNKLPIEVEGADVGTEWDGEKEGGNVVVTRHTLAGEFLQWCKYREE